MGKEDYVHLSKEFKMAATAQIDKKITAYLPQLSRKQKEAVLNVVKTFAEEETDHWKDEAFVTEMKKRAYELESGKVKGKSWEEVKASAHKLLKQGKSK